MTTNGEVHVYYGANTQVSSSAVSADGRLATAADGLAFVDRGVVLNHRDGAIWGSGDELFPVVGLQGADKFVAYYIPNGTGTNRTSAQRGDPAPRASRSPRV